MSLLNRDSELILLPSFCPIWDLHRLEEACAISSQSTDINANLT